jgi:nicotinate-nucleotide adenylyltransferase
MTRLGILGGTFDPVHYGHLDAADAARTALSLDDVLFVPAHDPPHKPADPRATPFHRFALVALAIDAHAGCRVSDMELRRQGPSYTVTTLRELHEAGWMASQLFFILGSDAFAEIATWHEYPAVLDCANFAVIMRPGVKIDAPAAHRPKAGGTGIYHVEARTRDVSSTTIRARLAAGQPLDDLVPAAVARHILAHHLYGASDDRHG